jgi:hypothetical protein
MQAQIESRIDCATLRIGTPETKRLMAEFTTYQAALIGCLNEIDQRLLSCRRQVDEYKETCSVLIGVNERLGEIGEEPLELPHFVSDGPGDLILERVARLKLRGKI